MIAELLWITQMLLRRRFWNASELADCVITTGGVSVGEEDHVKAQVQRLGRLDLWKLAIKPGKPLAFGSIGTQLSLACQEIPPRFLLLSV